MTDNHQKNIATFIHLSTFSRFVIPLGNYLGPIILWMVNKDKSEFVDAHGKQAINFQISILLYVLIIGTLTIPFFIFNVFNELDFVDFHGFHNFSINIGEPSPLLYITGGLGFLAILGFILEMVFIVVASLKARDGELYKYPLTINFLK
ncbi:DUF4870 domain-containing protein [Psychroserpens sp.]|uniref:DUF4870 domain-containing protein n=1 Tax=Psychroserpens sp. TaxID=2020870 RepID=UPI001B139273|nr:DUF4870 domain-containing protein [Psychroserpens sp.]MBO6607108.1 DUF4870 domain-containing protein [Psychroserpens sp.]MBO6631353.1 DUF4870 domain-containing protein [Psychroserpens sp.]MBO6654254.1 DUF4870 domain-containing protein [Psychroserpens sp.]MBO6682460.1 DUF4870 domain-containing protein [Psychroserpens sp.]MBO6750880.1 DUF4870 domain-containing protein [Psychroserpens sp.]